MRPATLLGLLLGGSVALLALGLAVGSSGWSPAWGPGSDPAAWQILWEIRAPRSTGAWLAGALLGLAGALAQGLFRNPLADPYLLGSASGASLGVATLLSLLGGSATAAAWGTRLGLTGAAFLGAVSAVWLTLTLARGVHHTLRLLLAGVVVGVVFGAIKELTMLWAPDIMRSMQAFMLGTTGFLSWSSAGVLGGALLISLLVALAYGRALDALALGEATAASLGVQLRTVRIVLVAALALATGAAVAQAGVIAFVGLVAPHLVRGRIQVTHRALLVLSAATGGVLLLGADIAARWVLAPQELPVGVLTAVLGGCYLLWRMHRSAVEALR